MSEAPQAPAPEARAWTGWVVGGAVLLAALLTLIPGLGSAGLWTLGELPVLDRTLAALGEPRADLLRHPWLPDQLRTWTYAALGRSDFGLRLPGALAGVGLVAMTLGLARRLGWSWTTTALAGGFALASPVLLASSRTVLGNPTGELFMTGACLALVAALSPAKTPKEKARRFEIGRRLGLGLVGLASLAASVASLGIVIGGCLPLILVALADVARAPEHGGLAVPRPAAIAAWAGAAIAGFAGLWLAWHQGEGYIPLLGAARDLTLLEDPTKRVFTASLENFGYQLFPFTGLVIMGLLAPGRARWPALWLGVAVIVVSLWSLRYGATPVPATVPGALLASAATKRMLDSNEPIASRRLLVLCAVLGAIVLGKDAGRTPALIASPLLELGVLEFPTAGVVSSFEVPELLPRLAKRFALLCLIAHVIAPPSVDQTSLRNRVPKPWWLRRSNALANIADRLLTGAQDTRSGLLRARQLGPILIVALALIQQIWGYGRTTLDQVGEQMSIAGPLQRFAAAVERGEIPDPRLSLHRIRDPGLDYYGPGDEHEVFLQNRGDLDQWLGADEPRTALIRRDDLPPSFSAARTGTRPFYVLDNRHHEYVLVANFLPAGTDDQNPLLGILHDRPVTLANQTLIGWDPYVELIAWEIEGTLHRGSKATMHMIFRVKRPLPSGTKLYARLQKGKVSRVAAEPHELTGGALPPNYWRAGDYVHHRMDIEVPWLEVLPGEHELIVGLRRSEKSNLKISTPEGKTGEFDVVVRGKSHEFATIGVVDLAW